MERPFCVVHIASGDLWAGAEVQVHTLARALAHAGVPLHVIVLNRGELEKRLRADGVAVSVLDERRLGFLRILIETFLLCRKFGAHIVHSHRLKENVIGALTAFALPGCRSLRTSHGAPEHAVAWWRVDKRISRALDRLVGTLLQSRVVAVSEELRARLHDRFPARRLAVIENGIDVEAVRASAGNPIDLPRREGVARVVLVGRLVPVKRVDLFVDCARLVLAQTARPVEFLIYGDGPLEASIRARIDASGFASQIRLAGFRPDLPAHLARADLLLMPSDHEGLPMTLLEAMALEVPVAVHAVGGMPAVLGEGEYGTLVREQNAQAFAAIVEDFLHDPAPYRLRARRALAHLRERYSAQASARRYLALYTEVLGRLG